MDLDTIKAALSAVSPDDLRKLAGLVGDLASSTLAGKSQALLDGVGAAVAGREGDLEGLIIGALAGRSQLLGAGASAALEAARPVVQGAWEDIRTYGLLVATDLVAAHVAGDRDWIDELNAQLRALAERTRVRVDAARWSLVETIFRTIFRAAVAALGFVKP